ncbi:YtfJ family protein [Cronobacter universalis]|uniref:YtfJ family protein n=1 Tax=Cronobacter universalis TaxID=535744 RepID=UPI0029E166E0|nr:YtfJ family protein [Cronobacter universalis]ELY3759137.1 YtfJ family protein [Cronobacter universalis]ELY6247425.1 YtfJ family protein [Cronobacter universalis]ELY7390904.1 YtfJ family protein [Cronobacter universalis]
MLRSLLLICTLLPFFACAHNLAQGERVAPVGVNERGELTLSQGEIDYRDWNSARLSGKVGLVLHVAGRLSAKDLNKGISDAIAAARLPAEKFQATTIINTDDAIPGSAIFVRRSLESTKKEYPSSVFVLDGTGAVQRAWRLQPGGSAVVVLDKDGRVRFAKDGALTADEVSQVMTLLRSLLT